MGMKDGMARLGKVIDHTIDKFIGIILETRKGYNQTVFLYNASGDDSVPCKNDKVIILKIDGTGNFIGAGILVESQGAKPGEKIFFGRDADGKIVSKFSMLNNGDVKAGADNDILFSSKGKQEYRADKDLTLDTKENLNTEAKKKATLKGADVEVNGKVKITGGTLECKGMAAPTGTGCLCAQPFCLITGAPQSGDMAQGT
jgi:hypothetical protein